MLIDLFDLVFGEDRFFRIDEILWIIGYVLGRIAPIVIGYWLSDPASKLILHLMGY